MAADNEYLMHEILAFSALHMAHYRPAQRDRYVLIGLTHHQAASGEAVKLLEHVTKENAASLFMFSALAIMVGMVR